MELNLISPGPNFLEGHVNLLVKILQLFWTALLIYSGVHLAIYLKLQTRLGGRKSTTTTSRREKARREKRLEKDTFVIFFC